MRLSPLVPGYVSPAPSGQDYTYRVDVPRYGTVPTWDVPVDEGAWIRAIVAWSHGISISSLAPDPRPARRTLEGDPTVKARIVAE